MAECGRAVHLVATVLASGPHLVHGVIRGVEMIVNRGRLRVARAFNVIASQHASDTAYSESDSPFDVTGIGCQAAPALADRQRQRQLRPLSQQTRHHPLD